MILIVSIAAGFLAALLRAWIIKKPFKVPKLKDIWLIFVAFAIQLLIFSMPSLQGKVPLGIVKTGLIVSLAGLLAFSLINISASGFWLISLGVAANLLVISLNGGLMPISPETVQRLLAGNPLEAGSGTAIWTG